MHPEHNQRHQDNRCHTKAKQRDGAYHKYYDLKRRSRGRDAYFGTAELSGQDDERNKGILEQAH